MANKVQIIELVGEHLQSDEEILQKNNSPIIIDGQYETKIMGGDSLRTGYLIATNQRVIFYAKKITGYEIESFPYAMLSSFEGGKNFLGNHIQIVASGNTANIKWITDKTGYQILLDTVHAEMTKSKVPSRENLQQSSIADELIKISQLLENKSITEEEFRILKSKIIN